MQKIYQYFFIFVAQNPDTVANSPVSGVQISQECMDDGGRLSSLRYECFQDPKTPNCIPRSKLEKIKCLTEDINSFCQKSCQVNYHTPSSTLVIEKSQINTNNICNFKEPEFGNECNFQYDIRNVIVEDSLINNRFLKPLLKSLKDSNFSLNLVKSIYPACQDFRITLGLGTVDQKMSGFSTMLTSNKTQGDDLILSQTNLFIDNENNVCQRGILFADSAEDEGLKTILDQREPVVKTDTGQRWMINGNLYVDDKDIGFFLNQLSVLPMELIDGQDDKTIILGQWEQEKKTDYTKQIKMKHVANKPDFVKMNDESSLFCNYNTVVDRKKNIWGCTTQEFLFDKYDYKTLQNSSCQNFLNHQMNIWDPSFFMGPQSIESMICPTGLKPTILNLEKEKDKLNTVSKIVPKTWGQISNSSESSVTDPIGTSILIQEPNKIFGAKNMQLDKEHRLQNFNFPKPILELCSSSVTSFPETSEICPPGQQINVFEQTNVLLYNEKREQSEIIDLRPFFGFDGTSQDCLRTYIPGVSFLSKNCKSEASFQMPTKSLLPNTPNKIEDYGESCPKHNSYFTVYNAPLEQQGNQRYWSSQSIYIRDSNGIKKPINQLPGGKKLDYKANNIIENIFQKIVFNNQDEELTANFTKEQERLKEKYGETVSSRLISGCTSKFEGRDSFITPACNSYCRNPQTNQFGQVTVESCPGKINKIPRDSLQLLVSKKNLNDYKAVYNQYLMHGTFNESFMTEILGDIATNIIPGYAYNIACSPFGEPNKHNTGLPPQNNFLCWNTVIDNLEQLGGPSTYYPYRSDKRDMADIIMSVFGFFSFLVLNKIFKSVSINSLWIILHKYQYNFLMLIEAVKNVWNKDRTDEEKEEIKKLKEEYIKNLELKKHKYQKQDVQDRKNYYEENKFKIDLLDPGVLVFVVSFAIAQLLISFISMSELFENCLEHLSLNQCTISNQRSVLFLSHSIINVYQGITLLFFLSVFLGRELFIKVLPKKLSKIIKHLKIESYIKVLITGYLFECIVFLVIYLNNNQ